MVPKPHTLCSQCAQVFQPTYTIGDGGMTLTYDWKVEKRPKRTPDILVHHESYAAFEKSASECCHLCLLFWNQVPDHKRVVLRRYALEGRIAIYEPESQLDTLHRYDIILHYSFPPDTRREQGSMGFRMTLHMMIAPGTSREIHLLLMQLTLISKQDPRSDTNLNSKLSSTEEMPSWSIATKWIHDCHQNHQGCLTRHPSTAKVSRLILVGERANFSDIRLEIRPNTGWKHHYVALSHCWGSSLPFKLLQKNLQTFQERLPFQELTQTFQHAIIATRKLSKEFDVAYLWIDALCIIQDSDEDWKNEAVKMGDVYQTAFATLAATFDNNGEIGLFQQRSSLSLSSCVIDAQWSQTNRLFACEDRRALTSVIENSALCRRAWVLQERALSPRILHFTAQQLFWECLALDACEAYPKGMYKTKGIAHFKTFSFETWKYERGRGPHQSENNNAHLIWENLVSRYTAAAISRESDKLVAIGGLAAKFQDYFRSHDQYLGGLWSSQLPAQLLWKVVSLPRMHYPHDYQAPSWSWASVDGSIQGLDQNSAYEVLHVEILDHTIKYVNDNLALGVENGKLRLRGFINVLSRNFGVSPKDVDPDLNKAPKFPLKIEGMQLQNNNMHLQFDTASGNFGNHRLYALAVASSQDTMKGLIIRMTMDRIGEFKRCGWFQIRGSGECQNFLQTAKQLSLRQLEYEGVDEKEGRYIISIV